MANRRGQTEDSSRGRNNLRNEEPVHKSAVANFIKHGHANTGCVGMYYGRKKRPAAEEIDIVKEKIASFKKIRKLKTISELMAELESKSSANTPTLMNGAASKYKHAPPPQEQEPKARAYYSCTPTSVTRLKIIRKTSPPQMNEASKKYSMKEDILQKASSLKYYPSARNNQPQTSSLENNFSQSNQASPPKASFRHLSRKNDSPQGFSIDEDQMYQYSSPNRVHSTKKNMSQELPVVDSQVSQPTNNFPEKLPLVERAVPERLPQMASPTASTDNIPMKPPALRDNTSQKASPLKNFNNRESLSANDGSSRGPSFVNNENSPEEPSFVNKDNSAEDPSSVNKDNSPKKDQPTEADIPQENHCNATLKIYCDYMKKIGVQKMEGLTGNYCFKDNVFREWHEGLYRPTYGGELLEILPYSVTD